jgi:hypothetical protein
MLPVPGAVALRNRCANVNKSLKPGNNGAPFLGGLAAQPRGKVKARAQWGLVVMMSDEERLVTPVNWTVVWPPSRLIMVLPPLTVMSLCCCR